MAVLGFNSNVTALNANRHLDRATKRVGQGYERLATGLRINRASDDAAGLAVADTLRVNSRLYGGASRNINDAISALSIVDSTLGEQSNVTQRLIELSEQAANGTLSDAQRTALNKEYQALVDEFGRLADATSFNGLKLLNGIRGGLSQLSFQTGITGQASARLSMSTGDTGSFSGYLQYERYYATGVFPPISDSVEETSKLLSAYGNVVAFTTVRDNTGKSRELALGFYYDQNFNTYNLQVFQRNEDYGPEGYIDPIGDPIGAAGGWYSFSSTMGFQVDPVTGAPIGAAASGPLSTILRFDQETVAATFSLDVRGLTVITNSTTQRQQTAIDFTGVETSSRATAALTSSKARLAELGTLRGNFGATLARLETAQNVTQVSGENTAAAESRIRDADISEEAAGLVAAQIVQSAGAAILSQANLQPSLLLFLLNGET